MYEYDDDREVIEPSVRNRKLVTGVRKLIIIKISLETRETAIEIFADQTS